MSPYSSATPSQPNLAVGPSFAQPFEENTQTHARLSPADLVHMAERELTEVAERNPEGIVGLALPGFPFSHVPSNYSTVFAAPGQPVWLGIGRAVTLQAEGATRFADIARRACETASRFSVVKQPLTVTQASLRWFGGFSFSGSTTDLWQNFGAAQFTLPRIVARSDGRILWVFCPHPADKHERNETLHLLHEWCSEVVNPHQPVRGISEIVTQSEAQWSQALEAAQNEIQKRHLEKIVLSRQARFQMDQTRPDAWLLEQLASEQSETYRFGFVSDNQAFVCASPELLISRQGQSIFSEAQAGSQGKDRTAAQLLASNKDREEQAFVVSDIKHQLMQFCSELSVPHDPVVRSFPYVDHLLTPITGTLRDNIHVLELANALHPTAAVGGVPRRTAVAYIDRNEPDRGWYAAPVGWFNSLGDGEFAVGLRCGLFQGHTASLFSGCGITSASRAQAEYQETNVKMRALLSLFGYQA